MKREEAERKEAKRPEREAERRDAKRRGAKLDRREAPGRRTERSASRAKGSGQKREVNTETWVANGQRAKREASESEPTHAGESSRNEMLILR